MSQKDAKTAPFQKGSRVKSRIMRLTPDRIGLFSPFDTDLPCHLPLSGYGTRGGAFAEKQQSPWLFHVIMSMPRCSVSALIAPVACAMAYPSASMKKVAGMERIPYAAAALDFVS